MCWIGGFVRGRGAAAGRKRKANNGKKTRSTIALPPFFHTTTPKTNHRPPAPGRRAGAPRGPRRVRRRLLARPGQAPLPGPLAQGAFFSSFFRFFPLLVRRPLFSSSFIPPSVSARTQDLMLIMQPPSSLPKHLPQTTKKTTKKQQKSKRNETKRKRKRNATQKNKRNRSTSGRR